MVNSEFADKTEVMWYASTHSLAVAVASASPLSHVGRWCIH